MLGIVDRIDERLFRGALGRARALSGRLALRARHSAQELRELGLEGSLFRLGWELKLRSGAVALLEKPLPADALGLAPRNRPAALMRERIPPERMRRLIGAAEEAARGRILCFGRWTADFGDPFDWHLNPVTGERWDPRAHWSRTAGQERRVGDIKHTWEAARFPQAYLISRAAAHRPERRSELAAALARQIESFIASNPPRLGVHWNSGQELALRAMAWSFAFAALGEEPAMAALRPQVARSLRQMALHVEEHRAYAQKAVHNNHLIAEAGMGLLGALALTGAPEAPRWRADAGRILDEEAEVQFYPDGGYIQQSHTYHRVALQLYLGCASLLRASGEPVPRPWLAALERSLDFLVAHQNPADGWLPNYGNNDGAMPLVLSTCDFPDFRPTLQAASLLTRGERLYEPGPWDEEAAWLLGARALEAPLRAPSRTSSSFGYTGSHVLRGARPDTFCAFRCGSLRDRFSQIDMLHLDVWWRGLNVLADGGTYQYNAADAWHRHFMGTASHNTLTVDGLDQMLHYRRFKTLFPTPAELHAFAPAAGGGGFVSGSHYGFRRHPGGCTHRRSVLMTGHDLIVVVDSITGEGAHQVRLQWLGGAFPFAPRPAGMELETPEGKFLVAVFDSAGRRAEQASVVAGGQQPPRGWLSRYYGEKVPAPSLVVEASGLVPLTLVSVLSAGEAEVEVVGCSWKVRAPEAGSALVFTLASDGSVAPQPGLP